MASIAFIAPISLRIAGRECAERLCRPSGTRRGSLIAVPRDPFQNLQTDTRLPIFEPESGRADMDYTQVRCLCGSEELRLVGWPRIAGGSGSYFWRTLTRVWREARMPMGEEEPIESPFWLPVFVVCMRCDRETLLFDDAHLEGRMPPEDRRSPREAYRCRVCRRSKMTLVAGRTQAPTPRSDESESSSPAPREAESVEVIVRCHSCQRQARVAWFDGRPSERTLRLDALYGRR